MSGHNKQDGACSRMKRMCFSCSGLNGSTRYFIVVKPLYIATFHTTLESRRCRRYAWIRSHRTQNTTSPRVHCPTNKTGVLLAINLQDDFLYVFRHKCSWTLPMSELARSDDLSPRSFSDDLSPRSFRRPSEYNRLLFNTTENNQIYSRKQTLRAFSNLRGPEDAP